MCNPKILGKLNIISVGKNGLTPRISGSNLAIQRFNLSVLKNDSLNIFLACGLNNFLFFVDQF